jgi:hypothetical protein
MCSLPGRDERAERILLWFIPSKSWEQQTPSAVRVNGTGLIAMRSSRSPSAVLLPWRSTCVLCSCYKSCPGTKHYLNLVDHGIHDTQLDKSSKWFRQIEPSDVMIISIHDFIIRKEFICCNLLSQKFLFEGCIKSINCNNSLILIDINARRNFLCELTIQTVFFSESHLE